MTRQRRSHRVRRALPQSRRTLDVGEQERHRPRRHTHRQILSPTPPRRSPSRRMGLPAPTPGWRPSSARSPWNWAGRGSPRPPAHGGCGRPATHRRITCPAMPPSPRGAARDVGVVVVSVGRPGDLLRPGDRHTGRAETRPKQPQPHPGLRADRRAVAVMAALGDRCTVNGKEVVPQPGGVLWEAPLQAADLNRPAWRKG